MITCRWAHLPIVGSVRLALCWPAEWHGHLAHVWRFLRTTGGTPVPLPDSAKFTVNRQMRPISMPTIRAASISVLTTDRSADEGRASGVLSPAEGVLEPHATVWAPPVPVLVTAEAVFGPAEGVFEPAAPVCESASGAFLRAASAFLTANPLCVHTPCA